MKKVLFILLLVLPFAFTACSDDDDDALLAGTVWGSKIPIGESNADISISFLDADRCKSIIDNGLGFELEIPGSYKYLPPNVTITDEDGVHTGVISGNTMTLSRGGLPLVFTKK